MQALPPTVDEVIVEVTESAYPIITKLDGAAFTSFGDKVGKLLLDLGPAKIGKTIDLALDAYATVPDATVKKFDGVVGDAFSGLKPDSCTLVPLPSRASADKFASLAKSTVDSGKLSKFSSTWGPTVGKLSTKGDAICLPPVDTLTKLALAQAEVGRSFDYDASQAFIGYTQPMLKNSIKLQDVFPLLEDAANVAPDVTSKEKLAFQKAGKRSEAASKAEQEKQAMARYKAKSAAAAAAKAAAK